MASSFFLRALMLKKPVRFPIIISPLSKQSSRSVSSTEFGGFHEEPVKARLGVLKAALVLIPAIYVGGSLAKHGAAFLEDNDIFVPTDED